MATPPSLEQFRARVTITATDPEITAAITAAGDFMDEAQWIPEDFIPAWIYLAAHFLIMQQAAALGTGGGGVINQGDDQVYVASIAVEGRTVTWGRKAGASSITSGADAISATANFFQKTFYGQLYYKLFKRNIIPIMVVGGPEELPPPDGYY